jgi:serine/threonine protein kinase
MATFSSSGELAAFSGARADQYEVEREIGRGGMGVVYLARDLRLDRMVAIKTLPPALASDDAVRERFLREARTVARLNHPNIVPIHRADEINGQVFFVMGFIDGDSLAARIATAPLSPRDALPILRDVAAALGYAHKHGVVHRDVKTENILLDTITGRTMVTDFGIARVAAAAPLTSTGQVLGTVYYLSPEQVADTEVDARSDIYALGVVGFVMLSGQFPFDGTAASAVLISHVIKPPPPLASVAPHVPRSLTAIIDRCLVKDPAGRFQSCAELDAALESVRAEADAVAVVPAQRTSPLLSNTEAQQVLGRAAQLSEMTGARQAPPAQPKPRDKAADLRRQEGFKTGILRDAAAESGIDPKHMEQALAEHGLRPSPVVAPERVGPNAADATENPPKYMGHLSDPVHEIIIEGEVREEDYDLMVGILGNFTGRDGLTGSAASVGRALTWNGHTHSGRELKVAVVPRAGRTTIRISERLKWPLSQIYFFLGGGIAGIGVLTAAAALNQHHFVGGALALLGFGVTSWFVARMVATEYAKHREDKARELLDALTARARDIAGPGKS